MMFLPLVAPEDEESWAAALSNETMIAALDNAVEDFKLEFYLNPSALDVAVEDSNSCGNDITIYPHMSLPPWNVETFSEANEASCLGEKAAETWPTAWRSFLEEGRGRERLEAGGFTEDQIEEMAGWAYGSDWKARAASFVQTTDGPLLNVGGDFKALYEIENLDDLAILDFVLVHEDPTKFSLQGSLASSNPGHLPDSPLPYLASPIVGGTTTSLVSTDLLLGNRDTIVPFLAGQNKRGQPWYVYGGAILNGHDQMTAIPASRREGGLYMHLVPADLDFLLPLMFGEADRSAGFLGFVGHNHHVRHGPLKEDWTKTCPLAYTPDKMDELCVSEQEATWGTDLLRELEEFKKQVDPQAIMTCATGVGYVRGGNVQEDGNAKTPNEDGGAATDEGSSDSRGTTGLSVSVSAAMLGLAVNLV